MRKIVEMRKVPACEEQQLMMMIIMLIKKKTLTPPPLRSPSLPEKRS